MHKAVDWCCSAASKVVVKDLQPGTTYLLQITAKNEVGYGRREQLSVKTKSLSKLAVVERLDLYLVAPSGA